MIDFLAMKTIASVCLLYVVTFITGGHTYRTIVPNGSFPVGHVIQEGDFDRGLFGSNDKADLDLATDPKAVIGHTVVKQLHAGSNLHMADIR
jgi:hypothetical protein